MYTGKPSVAPARIRLVRVDDEGQLLDQAAVLLLGGALCLEEAHVLNRHADVGGDRCERARRRPRRSAPTSRMLWTLITPIAVFPTTIGTPR